MDIFDLEMLEIFNQFFEMILPLTGIKLFKSRPFKERNNNTDPTKKKKQSSFKSEFESHPKNTF